MQRITHADIDFHDKGRTHHMNHARAAKGHGHHRDTPAERQRAQNSVAWSVKLARHHNRMAVIYRRMIQEQKG